MFPQLSALIKETKIALFMPDKLVLTFSSSGEVSAKELYHSFIDHMPSHAWISLVWAKFISHLVQFCFGDCYMAVFQMIMFFLRVVRCFLLVFFVLLILVNRVWYILMLQLFRSLLLWLFKFCFILHFHCLIFSNT